MDINENLKKALLELKEGEIATVAMIDRGPYAEPEDVVEDSTTSASQRDNGIFVSLAAEVKTEDEDLSVVQRKDDYTAMTQEDFDWFADAMTAAKHLVFVQCLALGTSEIKGFLQTLRARNLLATSKVVLLDLPQIEYLTLRDALAGQIQL